MSLFPLSGSSQPSTYINQTHSLLMRSGQWVTPQIEYVFCRCKMCIIQSLRVCLWCRRLIVAYNDTVRLILQVPDGKAPKNCCDFWYSYSTFLFQVIKYRHCFFLPFGMLKSYHSPAHYVTLLSQLCYDHMSSTWEGGLQKCVSRSEIQAQKYFFKKKIGEISCGTLALSPG